ncbi:MAG: NRDE family protein [Acidobacteriota bacterium]
MCTVSWLATDAGGYELFFNRDEQHTRQRAAAPSVHEQDGVRFLAPIDTDAGGTWLLVNEHGVTMCLLNRYPPAAPQPVDQRSRGLLLLELASAPRAAEVFARLSAVELRRYRPFTLLALDRSEPAQRAWWDGRRLSVSPSPSPVPLFSSSKRADEVAASRQALWRDTVLAAGGPDRARQLAYHRSREPERGALSPCMHRDDAATVSFSWVRVDAETVSISYADGAPCDVELAPPLTLGRRALLATA